MSHDSVYQPTLSPADAPYAAVDAQVEQEFACRCGTTEVRFRLCSNGVRQYVRQCVVCGTVSQAIKQADLTPEQVCLAAGIDDRLRSSWSARRLRRRQELVTQVRRADLREKRDRYAEYLQTDRWRQKREAVLRRDGYRCQAQLPGCEGRAAQAHHLTYDRVFNEPLFDLAAVCGRCHGALHMDRDEDAQ